MRSSPVFQTGLVGEEKAGERARVESKVSLLGAYLQSKGAPTIVFPLTYPLSTKCCTCQHNRTPTNVEIFQEHDMKLILYFAQDHLQVPCTNDWNAPDGIPANHTHYREDHSPWGGSTQWSQRTQCWGQDTLFRWCFQSQESWCPPPQCCGRCPSRCHSATCDKTRGQELDVSEP